jgi:hexosaminidase
MFTRYKALGIDYAASAFTPRVLIEATDGGSAKVRLDTQAGLGEIRYTLDGSPPDAASPVYKEELDVAPPATLTAATFIDGKSVAVTSAAIDGRNHLRRKSQELKSCEQKLVLNLEDDAPLDGPRAVFLIDIMNPCWIFERAELTGVSEIEARVGQLPFNFQIGEDINKIKLRPPQAPEGELEVRLDSCDGALAASLPLTPAVANAGVTTLRGEIRPASGAHDLCLMFTSDRLEPMWAVDEVRLVKGGRGGP